MGSTSYYSFSDFPRATQEYMIGFMKMTIYSH